MSGVVKPGDRVLITGIQPDDPAPLPIGSCGTVVYVSESQIDVDWDAEVGRSLMLLPGDPFTVIS